MPKIKSEQKSRAIRLNEEIEKAAQRSQNKKFTQDDLAAMLKIKQSAAWKIIHGVTAISDRHIILLNQAGFDTDYILWGHCKNCEKYIHELKIQHNRIAELMSENSKLIEKISYLEKLIRPK
jgi:transcriptional regulator with XRE-family HTH domain